LNYEAPVGTARRSKAEACRAISRVGDASHRTPSAYNFANFLRRLALPAIAKHWTLTTLRKKLIKIAAKMVRHTRYVTFQLTKVAIPRSLYQPILPRIRRFAAIPRTGPAPGGSRCKFMELREMGAIDMVGSCAA